MNEQVLQAILNLLVTSVKIDGLVVGERDLVENFLRENLKGSAVKKYLQTFDDLVSYTTIDPKTALQVCHDINHQLNRRQKIIVLLHLVQIGFSDFDYTEREEDFAREVTDALYIEESVLETIRNFVVTRNIYDLSSFRILIIDDHPHPEEPHYKHYSKPNWETPLAILRLPEEEMYFLRVGRYSEEISLNGKILNPSYVYPLVQGSVIRSEKAEPVYYSTIVNFFFQSDNKPRISFEARNVDFFFRSGRQGLHNIHIAENGGKLVALMGASGSGKSTLLNILNGSAKPQNGRVLINGMNLHQQNKQLKGIIGYVPQDDLLIEELTVYENLYYAARLSFARKSKTDTNKLVMKTLHELGLEEVANLKVGDVLDKTISGGQRKRVNIGLELLREPAVMFVDEPTSGLSSKDSQNIMDLLKELSLAGKLIFVVIHQPSSDIFKLFDKLIVLDKGGYQIYYGNPVEAVTYFKTLDNQVNAEQSVCGTCGNVNPEQIFEIIESRILNEYGRFTDERKYSPQEWQNLYKENTQLPEIETITEKPDTTLQVPNALRQWGLFTVRDWLSKLSNTQYLVINLLQAPLLALLLGYVVRFYKVDELTSRGEYVFAENPNIPAFMFMSIIVALFMGLTISAEEIIRDARLRKRERFLSLSRHSYLFSKMGILFSFSAGQTLLYTLVGTWIVGIENMTLTYWLVLFSVACFANLLGLNISQTFKSIITIYIFIPVLLIPQLILGGIVVKFDQINPNMHGQGNTPLIGDLMASRWAFEALMVSQFRYNDFEKDFYGYDRRLALADYKKNYYLPTLLSKVAYCKNNLDNRDEKFGKYLETLEMEMALQTAEMPQVRHNVQGQITPFRFTAATADNTEQYLNTLGKVYSKLYNEALAERDELIARKTADSVSKSAFLAHKQRSQNERVADLVTNRLTEDRIVEYNSRLVHKIYPVFFSPDVAQATWNYRTHFYAPEKKLFGRYFSTLTFNVGVLWLMTFFLYNTLYFKTFQWLISGKQSL
jgi:ABC transport system ATP-binding/permease protein